MLDKKSISSMVNENSTKKNTGEINAFSLARSLTDVDFANG